jgi:hypothetical protein
MVGVFTPHGTSLRTFSRADKDYKVPFNIHEDIESTIFIIKIPV